jgi:hypothetical protein
VIFVISYHSFILNFNSRSNTWAYLYKSSWCYMVLLQPTATHLVYREDRSFFLPEATARDD